MDQYKLPIKVTDDMLEILTRYSWPGNIRELENVCKRFCLNVVSIPSFSSIGRIKKLLSECIGTSALLADILKRYDYQPGNSKNPQLRNIICEIKQNCNYSYEEIAEQLGISRSTCWRILQKSS